MSVERLKPPRAGIPKAASKTIKRLHFASVAGCVKRAIVFTALRGWLPMNWATTGIRVLGLGAA